MAKHLAQVGTSRRPEWAVRNPSQHDNMMKAKFECMTERQIFVWGLTTAIIFEFITLWLRFGLHLESTRDTQLISMMTMGVRIHHGYLGIVLGLAAWTFLERRLLRRNLAYVTAIGLFVSDTFHHCFVLWPITGSPQFDLVYSSIAMIP